MTGQEFEAAVKAAGYSQSGFARAMGVHRTTIAERYTKDEVEPYWVFALAGLIASRAAVSVSALVSKYDNSRAKMSG
ncbi:helix-turn-helix transcriptional regulator [Chromobacterium haemolyticum]|uniref:Helix-turn-helix transcriptional regulator n=1 Tax=Chromobacterium fluminis TaxID=3044269 RepID=A0ABX0LD34_9NEIS|nr:helix-turn-helix transcriptional regulator [Chromobacterium haemolyticum]NHR07439.1 helix-turn-helix transcriptional regulator [Chromobacterium haemolyticum]